MTYDNHLYEQFKSLLRTHQAIQQVKAAKLLGITEAQLFERLMAWYANSGIEYRIIDDLIVTKDLLVEHDIMYKGKTIHYDEEEDVVTFQNTDSSETTHSFHKNDIKGLIKNAESSNKNIFIPDKLQYYNELEMREIDHADSQIEKPRQTIRIPKITRVDQIYWVCESCGQSNAYFLPKCKECLENRPEDIYLVSDKERFVP